MADTNILEKYNTIKQSALDTELITKVTLCSDEDEVLNRAANAEARELLIIPIDFALLSKENYVKFDILVIDKVNNSEDEEYILQSWSNGMAFIKDLTSRLNYKENENTVLESASFGTTRIGDENKYNTLTIITASLDLSIDDVTRIDYS